MVFHSVLTMSTSSPRRCSTLCAGVGLRLPQFIFGPTPAHEGGPRLPETEGCMAATCENRFCVGWSIAAISTGAEVAGSFEVRQVWQMLRDAHASVSEFSDLRLTKVVAQWFAIACSRKRQRASQHPMAGLLQL